MRILLIGEFSRLHNSLKEGLVALGHDVTIIANGDGFKNYPTDLSTKAKWCESKIGNVVRQIIYRITGFDIATLEFGIRFYFHVVKLQNFDIVQLINEAPIQTVPILERFLLRKIFKHNPKTFLLCCGVDYMVAKHLIEKRERYSIMNSYFENPKSHKEYQFILNYLKPNHQKTHRLVYKNICGVIASDIDYVNPIKTNFKYLGLIPNPINVDTINCTTLAINKKIIIFLGVNRGNYYQKGIQYFEKALDAVKKKYTEKIEIIIAENLPYQEYIVQYNRCHILLDQVFSYDQGYNALEAMAKGKVVFTGAEAEFNNQYQLTRKVAINATPDVQELIDNLSFLIENLNEILKISEHARSFVQTEHHYINISKKYVDLWQKHQKPIV